MCTENSEIAVSGYHRQFEQRVRRASELLGVPARPITLSGPMERALLEAAVLENRTGLTEEHAFMSFDATRRGRRMVAGMERFRLNVDGCVIPVIKIMDQLRGESSGPALDFCVVPEEQYVRLYRFLSRKVRRNPQPTEPAPIMREEAKKRLWDNSVGFLQRGSEVFKRYGLPQKRGILLTGEPGNGKTMACRWLGSHCERLGLQWNDVKAEEYERRRAHGLAEFLFALREPGIILFDDFDLAVRDREQFGPTSHHSTFLGELDGVSVRQGVVYLFTTNARLSELDPAFLRPGRIDQVIHFPKPDPKLRRQLVLELWHSDIRQAIEIDRVVDETEGLSFADIEELKKLLVLRFLDTQKWDWSWTLRTFRQDDRRGKPVRKVGFVDSRSVDLPTPLDSILNEV